MKNNLEAALYYHSLGWSVFPVGKDKKPLIKWAKYQDELATEEQIRAWATQWPDMNLGVATGALSGLVVLDLDIKHGWSSQKLHEEGYDLSLTATSRTGNGGEHFFLKHPGGNIRNSEGQLSFGKGVDIRGDGGFIVLAPSVTAYKDKDNKDVGGPYEWLVPPEDGIADMPDWLLQKIQGDEGKKEDWQTLTGKDCPEGSRNGVATSISGGLLRTNDPGQWEAVVWPRLQKWNQEYCKPPLSEEELRSTYESIAATEERRREDPSAPVKNDSVTTLLVDMVVGNPKVELFHDEYNLAYARVTVKGHRENLPCNTKKFKLWLTGEFFDHYGSAPQPSSVSAALATIESIAIFKGKEHKLNNRIARDGDVIWYDLADEQGRAVRITSSEWEITTAPPMLFRHEAHQLEQVEPVQGGDAMEIFRFVNVTDPDQRLLVLVYIVSCLIPGFPHPLLYIHGQQGSAKSSFSKILRSLIDPSKSAVLSFPKDVKELALQLSRHNFIFFENVSWLSQASSDMLCIAVTGGSISKRMLYTDADDFFVSIQTNVGINGINIAAIQPDLLERTILLGLERIEDGENKTQQGLDAGFDKERPRILGALFSAAAQALAIRPNIVLKKLPRMADFTQWGAAIAEALGFTKEEFLRVYQSKIREQSDEALEASTEATALIRFMETKISSEWEGEPARLLGQLRKLVNQDDEAFGFAGEELPKRASQLMRKLNVIKPNLRVAGIELDSRKVNGRRHVFIRKMEEKTVQSVPTAQVEELNGETADDTSGDTGRDTTSLPSGIDLNPGHKDAVDGVDDIKDEDVPF